MPELRKDPIIGRWVIIASERGKRPDDFPRDREERRGGFCPFCPGNEDKTPPEVLAWRPGATPANQPGWTVRVVPNKFPALQAEGELGRQGEGLFDRMNGVGAHEVVIESPGHDTRLHDLGVDGVRDVLWAARERMLALGQDPRFRYLLLFKNWGADAGASLEHSHLQIIATPIIPKRVSEEIDGSLVYFKLKERCIFCDIIRQETVFGQGVRVVTRNERFVALTAFASRFPFETWILPVNHRSAFESSDAAEVLGFAEILRDVLGRLDLALGDPSYNFVMHSSPCRAGELEHYHWHMEILPKLTKVAGFEWGSGFFINPTSPELAAQVLREAEVTVGGRQS